MSLLTASKRSGEDPKDEDDEEGREDDMYSRRSSLSKPSRVLSSNLLEFWYISDSVPLPELAASPPTAAVVIAITDYLPIRVKLDLPSIKFTKKAEKGKNTAVQDL